MALKEKVSKKERLQLVPPVSPLSYGDFTVAVAAFVMVAFAGVLWHGAGVWVKDRTLALKDTAKVTEERAELERLDGLVAEKTKTADTLAKQLEEKDKEISRNVATIADLQKKLTAPPKKASLKKAAGRKKKN